MKQYAKASAKLVLAAAIVVAVVACSAPASTRTVQLDTLNDSGVSGSVTLVEAGDGRTRVEISVAPGGNMDMPAHIHPGSCAELVPQPKYPLQNVIDGTSTTVVPAGLAELTSGGLAVNIHRSNDDLGTYTACADLR